MQQLQCGVELVLATGTQQGYVISTQFLVLEVISLYQTVPLLSLEAKYTTHPSLLAAAISGTQGRQTIELLVYSLM